MEVDTVDIIVDINRNDIRLHISGNWLSDLGNIFTIFFKGIVVDLIDSAVNTGLSTTLPAVINAKLIDNDAYIPFKPNFKVDWEMPEPAIVALEDWCAPIKGLFIANNAPIVPTVAIPSMPCRDSA